MTSLSAVVAGPLRSRPVSAPPGGPVGLVALTRAPLARGGSLSATTRIEGSVLRRGPAASTARDRPPAPASRPRRHRRPGGGGPRAASQVPLIPLITRTPSPVEHPGGADAGRWARSPRFLRTGRGAGHPGGPRMTPRPPRARSKGLASAPGTDEPRAAGQRPAHRARRPGTAAPSATRGTQPTGHPRLGAWRSAGHRSRSGRHQAGRQTTRPVARRVRTGPRPAPATTQRSICGPGAAGPAPGRRAPLPRMGAPCPDRPGHSPLCRHGRPGPAAHRGRVSRRRPDAPATSPALTALVPAASSQEPPWPRPSWARGRPSRGPSDSRDAARRRVADRRRPAPGSAPPAVIARSRPEPPCAPRRRRPTPRVRGQPSVSRPAPTRAGGRAGSRSRSAGWRSVPRRRPGHPLHPGRDHRGPT